MRNRVEKMIANRSFERRTISPLQGLGFIGVHIPRAQRNQHRWPWAISLRPFGANSTALFLLVFVSLIFQKTTQAEVAAEPEPVPVPAAEVKAAPVDDAAIQKLLAQLDCDDFQEREKAQAKLIELGSPVKAALQAATAKSKSADFKYRSNKILPLILIREKLSPKLCQAHVGIEVELLHDKKAWVKYFMLAKRPDEEEKDGCFTKTDMETLGIGMLLHLNELDRGLAQQAIRKISNWHLDKLIPALIVCLKNDEKTVCCTAAEVLSDLNAKEAVPNLIICMKDADKDVRLLMAQSLGKLGDKRAVPELIISLKENNENARTWAIHILGKLDAKEAIPDLIVCIKDSVKNVRASAIKILGKMNAKEAIPEITACLKDEDSEIKKLSQEALKLLQPAPEKK